VGACPERQIHSSLQKLQRTDPQTARRVAKALIELRQLNDPTTRCKALTGPLTGLCRLRVGDYRVIIDVRRAEPTLVALDLGHRSTSTSEAL
jgi:mRNA interferase RelE/StbE